MQCVERTQNLTMRHSVNHIETKQLISGGHQLTGFYISDVVLMTLLLALNTLRTTYTPDQSEGLFLE